MALPVLRSVLPVLLSATIVVASGPAPAVASPAPVRGTLLPVPAAGPGEQLTVTAVDAAPLGVVGGTA
jgi:anti-sigma factor RsiW